MKGTRGSATLTADDVGYPAIILLRQIGALPTKKESGGRAWTESG